MREAARSTSKTPTLAIHSDGLEFSVEQVVSV